MANDSALRGCVLTDCLFYETSIGRKRKVKEGFRRHLQAILDQ